MNSEDRDRWKESERLLERDKQYRKEQAEILKNIRDHKGHMDTYKGPLPDSWY